ncbi:MAG: hypothetical protein E5W21_38315, partial [Mesorhizobium sp.]
MALAVRNEASPWGISTSVLLHALLAATVVLMPLPKPPSRPEEEERVAVAILTPQQFEASPRPPSLPPEASSAPIPAAP